MDVAKFSIDKVDKERLLNAIKAELSDYYFYITDNIAMFITQKYFLRVNSNLMSVIILNFSDRYSVKIEVISGGGGAGLLQISWGSEGSANNSIINFFKKVCEANAWTFRY
jgi:hypothetical protein